MPNNDDQLAQQYQEILNKYASSLAPDPEVKPPETSINPPEPNISSDLIDNSVQSPVVPVLDSVLPPESPIINPVISQINSDPEPEIASTPIIPPVPVFSSPTVSEPKVLFNSPESAVPPIYFPPTPPEKKTSNFFKYLFYFSLVVFIIVTITVVSSFLNNQQTVIPVDNSVLQNPTPTVNVTKYCELSDKKYEVGQSFPSADSCNTCSCGSDLMIVCTQRACISPTSVQSTPSAKPTVKAITGKVYKDIKYGYQFQCPTTSKYLVEATSVNGNKIPYKQESCTGTDKTVVTIAVYDNTVVHSFGDLKTQISPDKKYIVTFEGDNQDIISSFKFL